MSTTAPAFTDTDTIADLEDSHGAVAAILVAVAVIVLLVLCAMSFRHRRSQDRHEQETHRVHRLILATTLPEASNSVEIQVEHLTLSGWTRQYKELVAKENSRLADTGKANSTTFTKLESPFNSAGAAPPTQAPL